MFECYLNLTEKQARELLKKHGIRNEDIERELSEAKADRKIISPMFQNLLYCFVLEIRWNKKKKYNIYQKAI